MTKKPVKPIKKVTKKVVTPAVKGSPKQATAKTKKSSISKTAKKNCISQEKKDLDKPLGRPTDYRPEYCEKIIEIMREGASAVEFCAEIGIHKDTLYEWNKFHPAFTDAFMRARLLCQAWWERQGRENLTDTSEYMGGSSKFNDRLWNKNMACRFKDDWVETKNVSIITPLDGDKSLLEALLAKPEVTK
jgi:hypothetical protein